MPAYCFLMHFMLATRLLIFVDDVFCHSPLLSINFVGSTKPIRALYFTTISDVKIIRILDYPTHPFFTNNLALDTSLLGGGRGRFSSSLFSRSFLSTPSLSWVSDSLSVQGISGLTFGAEFNSMRVS